MTNDGRRGVFQSKLYAAGSRRSQCGELLKKLGITGKERKKSSLMQKKMCEQKWHLYGFCKKKQAQKSTGSKLDLINH